MYFDSHAHYDFDDYDYDRDELLAGLPAARVDTVINVGAGVMSSYRSLKLARQYDHIYASAGVHPHYVDDMTEADLEKIRKLASDERCVAVGEIGFDYHYKHSTPDNQRKWFEMQLQVAKDLDMPVIIHSREAVRDTLEVLRKHEIRRGVVHCFTDDEEAAAAYVALGLYIGIGGVITFPNARHLVKAVQAVGVSRLLIETDCPFLSPTPFRGKRNDSLKLRYICEKIGTTLGMSSDEVANVTSYNASKLFGLVI